MANRKVIVGGKIYEEAAERKTVVAGKIFEETVAEVVAGGIKRFNKMLMGVGY